MELKVFTAFSGYDSQCLALERCKRLWGGYLNYELIGWSEIEPSAIKAHNALFPQWENRNFGDIAKINWEEVGDFDLFTYSFPCQSISNAGKQEGFVEGSGTRSSLLWECEKAIRIKHPKYLLMENVKALVQKKFMPEFQRWIDTLKKLGYTNYWQVLNAKDYGCAQNRERVFMVSILGEHQPYNFPAKIPLTKCVEDYMLPAEEIDESYFISQDRVTNKVLSDILDQPNVRAEMKRLYHEEWMHFNEYGEWPKHSDLKLKHLSDYEPEEYNFSSAKWDRYEAGKENLSNHFDVFIVGFNFADMPHCEYEREIKVDVWYHPRKMWRDDIRMSLPKDLIFENYEEFEDAIYALLSERYPDVD